MQGIQPFFIDTNGTIKFTTLSKSTIYKLEKNDPTFPLRIKITEKRSGFVFTEMQAWVGKTVKLGMAKEIKGSAK